MTEPLLSKDSKFRSTYARQGALYHSFNGADDQSSSLPLFIDYEDAENHEKRFKLIDDQESFVDMGLDALFDTQVFHAYQGRLGTRQRCQVCDKPYMHHKESGDAYRTSTFV